MKLEADRSRIPSFVTGWSNISVSIFIYPSTIY